MIRIFRKAIPALVFLVGVPALMVLAGGWPWPERKMSAEQVQDWLDTPMDPAHIVGTGWVIAWVFWAVFAACVVGLMIGRARSRDWQRTWERIGYYLPGPMQGLAATLLGTATVAAAGTTAAQAATPTPATATDSHPAVPSHTSGLHQAATPEASTPKASTTVVVRRGDTLWDIAGQRLGDPTEWTKIYHLNQNRYPMHGGDLIQPGWRLALPQHATPGHQHTPAKPKQQTSPANPGKASPAQPAPATPAGTDSAVDNDACASISTDDRGVSVPGGWVGLPFGGALVAAGAAVWMRRRRRYQHAPLTETPQDLDLRPLPRMVHHVRRTLREQAPSLLDPQAPAQPTVAEFAATPATARQPLPPPGPSGPELAGLGMSPDGVGLAGEGALAAARALLVATLSTGTSADPDAKGQVVITRTTLNRLLDTDTTHAGPVPRLHVTATADEALLLAEQLILERRRLLDDSDAETIAELRTTNPYHSPIPPVLLLGDIPAAEFRDRFSTTLRLGAPLQINGVLLGEWSDGRTVTVDPDGHADGGRLAVLDAAPSADLLHMLREANSTEPVSTPSTVLDTDSAGDAPVSSSTTLPSSPVKPLANGTRRQPVRIQLLGEVVVLDQEAKPVSGMRLHARELLVYLAVHRAGANLPDIMEAFWPTATVRRASERLSTEVASLRRIIRQAAGAKEIQPVVNTRSRYHLNPEVLDIDVWRLTDALRDARIAMDPASRTPLLRKAVDAHSGLLAEQHDYDWIETPREQLRRLVIRAQLDYAELLATDDPRAAAELARKAAALDPINEDLIQQAMRLFAQAGDAGTVAALLQDHRSALSSIEEEPSPKTAALATELQARLCRNAR